MSNVIYRTNPYINTDALENMVSYALRTDKDDLDSSLQSVAWRGQGVLTRTPQSAIDSFNAVKRIYQKENGNLLHHMVITFRTKRCHKPITSMDVMKIMSDVGFKVLEAGFQNLYFIHNEVDSIHVHFIFNSINYLNGKRVANHMEIGNGVNHLLKQIVPDLEWNDYVIYKKSKNSVYYG